MNITFILGNGFDIQCGLTTRYSDFLKEYTIIQKGDSENIKRFKAYLSKAENQELWSDAEKAMGLHLKEFSRSDIADFTDRIMDFETKMVEYLDAQQDMCCWDRADEIGKIFKDFISESFRDVISMRASEIDIWNNKWSNSYHFITFNYTNLLENIIQSIVSDMALPVAFRSRHIDQSNYLDVLVDIHHVHGELGSSIIMGVNDESQLKTGYGLELTNRLKGQLIKPEMSSAINHSWDIPAKQTIQDSDIIAIYGVSFGITDNLWWEEICTWLEKDPSHKIVAFIRDKNILPNFRLVWKIAEYEREQQSKILQSLGYTEDYPYYDQLMKQIYIIVNTTRLNLAPMILGGNTKQTPEDQAALYEMNSHSDMV